MWFIIKFKTLDGNISKAQVFARNANRAEMEFDAQYCYDEILEISEAD